jgi:hypothetical protein
MNCVVELDQLGVESRQRRQAARVALAIRRAVRRACRLRFGHAHLELRQFAVEHFEQPPDDGAAARLIHGGPLRPRRAGRPRPPPARQWLGADQPHPAMFLGARGDRAAARAIGVGDPVERPVAMNVSVLDLVPINTRLVMRARPLAARLTKGVVVLHVAVDGIRSSKQKRRPWGAAWMLRVSRKCRVVAEPYATSVTLSRKKILGPFPK